MLPNTPEMYEAHFGVPMCGAVLNTLNTRLDAEAIAFMLDHGEAKVLITDREFSPTIERRSPCRAASRSVIDVDDPEYAGPASASARPTTRASSPRAIRSSPGSRPADEWDAISLNYTSGTTGNPKGVVYHHRGAYLNARLQHRHVGHAAARGLSVDAADVPLQRLVLSVDHGGERRHQRLPAQGRRQAGSSISSSEHKVTHYCGAPIVHGMLINAPDELQARHRRTRCMRMVAAAAPPAAMIEGMERMGFDITHVYGLTETYGPATVCAKHEEWDALDIGARAERNGRQGVRYLMRGGPRRSWIRRP